MTNKHSYVACVRESTQNLPDIDSVPPFSPKDEACLEEVSAVLAKHGATSRFGVSLLHSHFSMGADEVLLEETNLDARKQTISVIRRSQVPAGAIFMDRRFDLDDHRRARALYDKMGGYENTLLIKKIQASLGVPAEAASILFEDVKKFLALCTIAPQALAPPRVVDQAWHEFILFTKEYARFCKEYCDRFIHHQPADPFTEMKDFGAERRRTRDFAEAVFAPLSASWDETPGDGSCTHNCGTGD